MKIAFINLINHINTFENKILKSFLKYFLEVLKITINNDF